MESSERQRRDVKRKVLIVDDHPVVRQGLARLMEQTNDLTVCAQAKDPREALEAVDRHKPDIAVVDLLLGSAGGLTLIEDLRLRYPDIPALVLTMYDEELYAERALRAGAKGFVMKSEASENLLSAVRQVLAGEVYLSPPMRNQLLGRLVGPSTPQGQGPMDILTNRELHVLQLVGRGHSSREIAGSLSLSVKTIETYYARIKQKLGIRNARELATRAANLVQSGRI